MRMLIGWSKKNSANDILAFHAMKDESQKECMQRKQENLESALSRSECQNAGCSNKTRGICRTWALRKSVARRNRCASTCPRGVTVISITSTGSSPQTGISITACALESLVELLLLLLPAKFIAAASPAESPPEAEPPCAPVRLCGRRKHR